MSTEQGPLTGVRVVELGGLGPAPFCAMVLADLGADVIRVERPAKEGLFVGTGAGSGDSPWDLLSRGRPSVGIDVKRPEGVGLVRDLCSGADVLLEGFRPGVLERLGLDPVELLELHDRLIVGRMTGWGRSGPLAPRAGHDINYLAVSGVLAHVGRRGEPPTPPLNLVADFGGGGLLLALGICAALVERATSGRGQIVDAAMVDGSALLMTPLFGASSSGFWSDERGTNLLDSGAPFYDVYRCADGGYVAVGAIEPAFWEALLTGLEIDPGSLPDRDDPANWDRVRSALGESFLTRGRDEWAEVFAEVDACVSPVLTMGEAPSHPHARAREAFCEVAGVVQPRPAPRFSRTPPGLPSVPRSAGADTESALSAWGIDPARITALREGGAIS